MLLQECDNNREREHPTMNNRQGAEQQNCPQNTVEHKGPGVPLFQSLFHQLTQILFKGFMFVCFVYLESEVI